MGKLSDQLFDCGDLSSGPGPAAEGWSNEAILPTLTEKSVAFIQSRKGNKTPFFLYFALSSPHTLLAPEERFIKNDLERTHLYLPLVRQTDYCVGEVLKAIDEAGLRDNTLVVFSSDNGSCATAFDGSKWGRDHMKLKEHVDHLPNGPFRGFKLQNWEGGHRIPFLIRWPGKVRPGLVPDVPFMLSDSFATFAALLGVTLPDDVAIDSVNVLNAWKGKAKKEDFRDRIFVHADQAGTGTAVRQGNWKLILHGKRFAKEHGVIDLFDLENDPQETTDLFESHPEEVERLKKALETERRRLTRL